MKQHKRIISFLLALCTLLSMIPVFTVQADAAGMSSQTVIIPDIPAEEKTPDSYGDAITYKDVEVIVNDYYKTVTTNGTAFWNRGIRAESAAKEIRDAVAKEYGLPTGKSCGYYLKLIPFLGAITNKSCIAHDSVLGSGGCYSNGFHGIDTGDGNEWQCQGFAAYMAYVVFGARTGEYSGKLYGNNAKNVAIKAGDVLRIRGSSDSSQHSIFVYKVDSSKAYTIECNQSKSGKNCIIYTNSRSLSTLKDYITQTSGKYYIYSSPAVESTYVMSDEEKEYMEQCTRYATYLNLEATTDGYIKTLPCSRSTNSASDDVRKLTVGEKLTALAVYKNSWGKYWYQVLTSDRKTGFIFGDDAKVLGVCSDAVNIAISLANTKPNKGSSVNITGSVSSDYITLKNVAATLQDAQGATQSKSISSGFGDIKSSAINDLAFGKLCRGPGTLNIAADAQYHVTPDGSTLETKTYTAHKTLEFTVMETYSVIYDANGGSGAPANQSKTVGTNLTISATEPTRSGYQFRGWAFSNTAVEPDYYPGDILGMDVYSGNMTLYAVWRETGMEREGVCGDNLNWYFDESTGKLTITGQGAMYDYSWDTTVPWADHCASIYSASISEGVTSIGFAAFYECTNLTTVELPDTLTSIGGWAFGYCSSLTALDFPDSLTSLGEYTFSHCSGLISVDLPAGLTSIGQDVFWACTGLDTITIPDSVTSISDGAFGWCNLSAMYFEGDAPAIESVAFQGATVNAYYHSDNPTWTSDVLQNYGGTINWKPYYQQTASGTCGDNLTWGIDEGVLTISGEGDMWDFNEDHPVPWYDYIAEITTLVIEEGVTGIGDNAFSFLPITSVTIPETVIRIGSGAFSYTMGMTSVVLPEGLSSIGELAFTMSALCEVTIPSSVESIGSKAFAGCPNLTAIHVDEANGAYYSWNGLLYSGINLIQVPGGCTGELELHCYTGIISDYALLYCGNLTKLILPAFVNEIGLNEFNSCSALTEIQFLGNVPETIAENAFDGITANISYPDSNTTWTDEVKQTFGDGITWSTHGEALVARGYCGESQLYDENNQFIGDYYHAIAGENATWTLTSNGTMTISGEGPMADCVIFAGLIPWATVAEQATRLVIEEGITYVGEFSFVICSEVTELVLPTTLQRVGTYAFNNMEKLEKVVIPEGATIIPESLLAYCGALTSLDFPASVTTIGSGAVGGCSALTEIRFHGDAPAIAEDAFAEVTATIYYPAGNDTWTEEVMQNYGGIITWKPYLVYDIIEEGTGDVVKEGEELEIHIDADHNTLKAVYMDGELVDPSNYTVTAGSTIITFKPEFLETLGEGEHKVTVEFKEGLAYATITVQAYLPGDITGDGKVNNRDAARLMQYLAGWDVEFVEAALDVNGDGKVSNRDAARLMQYLAGWDVEIH